MKTWASITFTTGRVGNRFSYKIISNQNWIIFSWVCTFTNLALILDLNLSQLWIRFTCDGSYTR